MILLRFNHEAKTEADKWRVFIYVPMHQTPTWLDWASDKIVEQDTIVFKELGLKRYALLAYKVRFHCTCETSHSELPDGTVKYHMGAFTYDSITMYQDIILKEGNSQKSPENKPLRGLIINVK
jgi:hypothetical protein